MRNVALKSVGYLKPNKINGVATLTAKEKNMEELVNVIEDEVISSTKVEKNDELKKQIKGIRFMKVKDNFNRETPVVRLTLSNGYEKELKITDDQLELVRILAEDNNNKVVKDCTFMNKVSKKKQTSYVGLDILLVNGSTIPALCSFSLMDIIKALAARKAPAVK